MPAQVNPPDGSFGPDYSAMISGMTSAMQTVGAAQAQQNQFQLALVQSQAQQSADFLKTRMLLDEASNNRFVQEQQAEQNRALEMYKIRVAENESVLDRLRLDNEARKEEGKQHMEFLKWQASQTLQNFAAAKAALELQRAQMDMQDQLRFRSAEQVIKPRYAKLMADLTDSKNRVRGAQDWYALRQSPEWGNLSPETQAQLTADMEMRRKEAVYRVDGSTATFGELADDLRGTGPRAAKALAALSGPEDPMSMHDVDPAVRVMASTYKSMMSDDPIKNQKVFAAFDALRELEAKYSLPGAAATITPEDKNRIRELKAVVVTNIPESSPLRSVVLSDTATDVVASAKDYITALRSTAATRILALQQEPASPRRDAVIADLQRQIQTLDLNSTSALTAQITAIQSGNSLADKAQAAAKLAMTLGPAAQALGFTPPPPSLFVTQGVMDDVARHSQAAAKFPSIESLIERDRTENLWSRVMGASDDSGPISRAMGTPGALNKAALKLKSEPLTGVSQLRQWASKNMDTMGVQNQNYAEDLVVGAAIEPLKGYTLNPQYAGSGYGSSMGTALEYALKNGRFMNADEAARALIRNGIVVLDDGSTALPGAPQPQLAVQPAAPMLPIAGGAAPQAPIVEGAKPLTTTKK